MPKQETHKDLAVWPFREYRMWLAWLAKNHAQYDGIWIKFAKKNSGIATTSYEEAREGAIVYGWIDGLINRYDENWYLTKFTPRRPRSKWSKINREIAEGLIKAGKIKPPGMAQIDAARQYSRWAAAYESPANISVPPELQSLLNKDARARKFFESVSRSSRYAFLYWIQNAVRPETRARRIEKTMRMLRNGDVPQSSIRKKK